MMLWEVITLNKIVRNYIKLIVLVVFTIIVTLLICNIYMNYNENKVNKSYLSKYVGKGDYLDISSILTEISDKQFLYLTYVGDKNINELEKDLRKKIKKYDLSDSFILIDCSDEIDNNMEVSNLNNILKVNTKNNIKLPAIIYYKDANPVDFIDSKDGIITIDKFEQLLDKWEFNND